MYMLRGTLYGFGKLRAESSRTLIRKYNNIDLHLGFPDKAESGESGSPVVFSL